MRFTINKRDVVDVMAKVQGLTGRRSSLAITECVRIQVADNHAHLVATDLESCYAGNFPAFVEASGTIAISGRKFFEIVREFPTSDIVVEESENRLISISDKKVQYHLMGMNADDFPPTPTFESVDLFEISAEALKTMIEKSIIISGIGEDKKPYINGVLFETFTDRETYRIRMVSTDGGRLCKFELTYNGEKKLPAGTNILIPKKGLHEATKFIKTTGAVQIGIQDSYFIIQGPAETLAIRLLEGEFPPYDEVVLREEGYLIEVEKATFHDMLKRMSILCSEKYRAAIFTFDSDLLLINAANPDIGESKEDMTITYNGPKIEAVFNPRFFIEALNNIDDQKVILNILNDVKPCLLVGVEDKSYLSAIMPMRV